MIERNTSRNWSGLFLIIACGASSLLHAQNKEDVEAKPVLTPHATYQPTAIFSPTPRSDENLAPEAFIDNSADEKHRAFLIEHFAAQGIRHDPGELGKEEQLSPSERIRRYGPRVEYHQNPPEEEVAGCMYTIGASVPDVCFDDMGKEIYNESRDDIAVFETLKNREMRGLVPTASPSATPSVQ